MQISALWKGWYKTMNRITKILTLLPALIFLDDKNLKELSKKTNGGT